jgi:hypothetical protein
MYVHVAELGGHGAFDLDAQWTNGELGLLVSATQDEAGFGVACAASLGWDNFLLGEGSCHRGFTPLVEGLAFPHR